MINPFSYLRDWMAYIPSKLAYERGFYEGGKITKANQDFWNANSHPGWR